MSKPAYRWQHQQRRRRLLAGEPECFHCGVWPATVADHQPSIGLHDHDPYWSDCCTLVPSCKRCSSRQGLEVRRILAEMRRPPNPQIYI